MVESQKPNSTSKILQFELCCALAAVLTLAGETSAAAYANRDKTSAFDHPAIAGSPLRCLPVSTVEPLAISQRRHKTLYTSFQSRVSARSRLDTSSATEPLHRVF